MCHDGHAVLIVILVCQEHDLQWFGVGLWFRWVVSQSHFGQNWGRLAEVQCLEVQEHRIAAVS